MGTLGSLIVPCFPSINVLFEGAEAVIVDLDGCDGISLDGYSTPMVVFSNDVSKTDGFTDKDIRFYCLWKKAVSECAIELAGDIGQRSVIGVYGFDKEVTDGISLPSTVKSLEHCNIDLVLDEVDVTLPEYRENAYGIISRLDEQYTTEKTVDESLVYGLPIYSPELMYHKGRLLRALGKSVGLQYISIASTLGCEKASVELAKIYRDKPELSAQISRNLYDRGYEGLLTEAIENAPHEFIKRHDLETVLIRSYCFTGAAMAAKILYSGLDGLNRKKMYPVMVKLSLLGSNWALKTLCELSIKKGKPIDREIVSVLKKTASRSNLAKGYLGIFLILGMGVEPDKEKGLGLLKKAYKTDKTLKEHYSEYVKPK